MGELSGTSAMLLWGFGDFIEGSPFFLYTYTNLFNLCQTPLKEVSSEAQ